jgi:putative transposase
LIRAETRRENVRDFVRRRIKTLWACDFLTRNVWAIDGLVEHYVLPFVHVGARRVHVAEMTPNLDGEWTAQQARNLCMFFEKHGKRAASDVWYNH